MDRPNAWVHRHRDVQGGWARASVFGINDGLVSNVALILGITGASTDAPLVRVVGVAGLLAGAVSMAAGEYISVKAQNELVVRELDVERASLADNPFAETMELARIYEARGLGPEHARRLATAIHADPEVALDVHAREELGIDPEGMGRPLVVAASSFAAFGLGAIIPLVPWFFAGGGVAVALSIVLAAIAAVAVGVVLARFTERSLLRTAVRQLVVPAIACTCTVLVGHLLGAQVS